MNYRIITYVIGWVLNLEAICMTLPAVTGLIYGEKTWTSFLITGLISALAGTLLVVRRPEKPHFFMKEGCVSVALSWIALSLIGSLPFMISGTIPHFVDALFETVSGFTTTGASIMASVEDAPRCILMWRSFTHWIGGMGVLVFVMMVMPMENDNSMHLVRAEVPGPTAGKLVPRMRTTSMILYGIYAAMTMILLVLLLLLGMPLFDSFCMAFGTAGTGGFAVSSAGVAGYHSAYIEILLGIFMLLFGVNFSVYHLLLLGKVKDALKSEEVKAYLGIVITATVLISINTFSLVTGLGTTVRNAFFQVASIMTTSGFATVDFNFWPEFSKHTLVLLMIIGACAGSTGGGFKISRLIILLKAMMAEVRHIITPKAINPVRIDGKPIDKETLNSTRIYAAAYLILICLFTWILSLDGKDLTTNVTAVLSCFNNIGPGLGGVGPMNNFGIYSDWAQVLLSLCMLTGRLEIFPMLLLFGRSMHTR